MTSFAVICILIALVSFRNVKIGLCFLLLTKCIFVVPVEMSSVPIGFGTFSGPDLVIISMLMRTFTVFRSKLVNHRDVFPLTLLIAAISISVVTAFLFDNGSAVALYRGLVENAIYYTVPLSMYLLNDADRKFVIRFGLVTAVLSIVVLSFLVAKGDMTTLTNFYPYYQDDEASSQLKDMLASGDSIPRILPSGILLILMSMAYCFAKVVLEPSFRARAVYSGLFCVYMLFVASTGTRGYIFAFVLMSALFLYGRRTRLFAGASVKPVLIFILLLLMIGGVLIRTKLGDTLIQRTTSWHQHGYRDEGLLVRFQDDINALEIIMGSPIGIGVTRPLTAVAGARAGMWDVHGVLTVGLLGGLPAMACLFWFLARLLTNYTRKRYDEEILACGAAVSISLILTFMNSTPAFISSQYILPFGIFSGHILSHYVPYVPSGGQVLASESQAAISSN